MTAQGGKTVQDVLRQSLEVAAVKRALQVIT
jgi:hypothetical protein